MFFTLSERDIEAVKVFPTKYLFKGLTDRTVLWKAKEMSCPLLTGDGKLRKEAQSQGIRVNGSIWVIEQLIANNLTDKHKAIVFFERLKEINNSLPFGEIDKRINKLQNSSYFPKEDT